MKSLQMRILAVEEWNFVKIFVKIEKQWETKWRSIKKKLLIIVIAWWCIDDKDKVWNFTSIVFQLITCDNNRKWKSLN